MNGTTTWMNPEDAEATVGCTPDGRTGVDGTAWAGIRAGTWTDIPDIILNGCLRCIPGTNERTRSDWGGFLLDLQLVLNWFKCWKPYITTVLQLDCNLPEG